jgi:hypothetical protein
MTCSSSVQAICDRLVANDTTLTELQIRLADVDDAELKLILDSAKKHKTVKKVCLVGYILVGGPVIVTMSLSVPAALSLASVASENPEIQEIEIRHAKDIEFGPIALEIQQNRKLTRLVSYDCWVTPNLLECIRWLLTENALETMTLINNECDGDPSFDISGALLGNSSLKELVLRDCFDYDVFGSETFQAIPPMIRSNQDFETIDLTTVRYELLSLIAQAAEGTHIVDVDKIAITYRGKSYEESSAEGLINHGGTPEAIGTMLHNAPALRDLSLSGCCIRSAGARHLVDGFSRKNNVVEKLDTPFNELGTEEAGIFARLLVANQNLKSLVLRNNHIGDAGALELSAALRQNKTLERLDLTMNGIGSDGATALADALVANDALKDLDLGDNSIGDDGATSIAEMLTRNESIEKVCIGRFGEKDLKAFATHLSSMNGLNTLEVRSSGYTSEIGNSFLMALEQNMTLETFHLDGLHCDVKVLPQVERLLALNRG